MLGLRFTLVLISAGIVAATGLENVMRQESYQFPEGFRFGVATAAYQVEGAWNVSDKSESIWDHIVHTNPEYISDLSNGDIADDSYHLYQRDVEMLRELGVDFYRFSLAWTRLLPSGYANKVSEDGLRYYNALIDELIRYGIEPVVTLYHWDLPQSLQDLGGWTNPMVATWFEDYARVAFENFGDRVKKWVTVNEPTNVCYWGYGGSNAIGLAPYIYKAGFADYLCTYHVLKAHARTYHLYNDEFRESQQGKVGLTLFIAGYESEDGSEANLEAVDDLRQFEVGIYAHPIFSKEGDFPATVKSRVAAKSKEQGYPRSRLPEFTEEEIEYIKGTADFFGMNHYGTQVVYRNSSVESIHPVPSYLDDSGAATYSHPDWIPIPNSMMSLVPSGFRNTLKYIKDTYQDPEILILENGGQSYQFGLYDDNRVSYYRAYLGAVLEAIWQDACNITAYTAWSLMDNFEWGFGYESRYGLYEVDYSDPDRKRTARKSALVYKRILETRQVEPDYEPDSLDIFIS